MNINLAEMEPANPLPGAEWIDSHVHFDSFEAHGHLESILRRAAGAGVMRMIAIGGSVEANDRAVRLSTSHRTMLSAVVGFDRDKASDEIDLSDFRAFISANRQQIVGIGESGLDYHYEPETAQAQKDLFEKMLGVAAETVLPVVVHSREADRDTIDMLRAYTRDWKGDPGRPGVLHCFTGSYEFARQLLDLGMFISFSGILTFRNADALRDCARRLPLDRILIETDAPYLAPVPHRGKTNEPALVPAVAETLASGRGDTLQTIAVQTTANARLLFQAAEEAL